MCLALCLEPWPTRGPGRLPEEEEEEDGQRGAGGVIKGEAKRGWRQIMIITKDDDGWLAAGSSRSGGGRKIPEGEGGGGLGCCHWPLLATSYHRARGRERGRGKVAAGIYSFGASRVAFGGWLPPTTCQDHFFRREISLEISIFLK